MTTSEIGLLIVALLVVIACSLMALSNRRKDRSRLVDEAAERRAEADAEAATRAAAIAAERRARLAEQHGRVVRVIELRIAADRREAVDAVASYRARRGPFVLGVVAGSRYVTESAEVS